MDRGLASRETAVALQRLSELADRPVMARLQAGRGADAGRIFVACSSSRLAPRPA
ncbi:MAG: hypothetical protein M3319_03975 [Actinomycetota bacterium]|nr:hypothetical protein [Actinomycetota bacterium]